MNTYVENADATKVGDERNREREKIHFSNLHIYTITLEI